MPPTRADQLAALMAYLEGQEGTLAIVTVRTPGRRLVMKVPAADAEAPGC